jgi:flagellar protein FliS
MANVQTSAYHNIQTITADPGRLVLMLYDGATVYLRRALRALERGDTAGFAQALSGANGIVAELSTSLDHDIGGEVAANLARLYGFMLRHLSEALVGRRRDNVEQVLGILETLRDAFDGAITNTPAPSVP